MTVKISQENGKAVVSVDGSEALKADAVGNVEVVGDLAVQGSVDVPGTLTTKDLLTNSVGTENVNGLWIGLGGGDKLANVAVGVGSLLENTTGVSNTAVGRSAAFKNTTGNENTVLGSDALRDAVTGSGNTAIGRRTLRTNVSGNNNTVLGISAGFSCTGSNNTILGSFVGSGSGIDITDSDNNIAISDGGGKVSFFKDSSDSVHLRTRNENRLTVQPTGNVSIANDLEVNGTTIAALIARIEALEAGN